MIFKIFFSEGNSFIPLGIYRIRGGEKQELKKLMKEEALIIQLAKKNDTAAQKMLFEHYYQAVFLLCLRYVSKREDAEELVLDAFQKAFAALQQFENRGEGAFRAWISTIAVNLCIRFLKSRKEFTVELNLNETKSTFTDDEVAIHNLMAKDLYQIIDSLPLGYKTVLNLYVMEGYTHSQIAQMLGIAENTSKSQLRKAKIFLQKKLKDYGK